MTEEANSINTDTRADHKKPSSAHQSPRNPQPKKKAHSVEWPQEPYNYVRGETGLWAAVITQAMMDALSKSRNPETLYHKHEAIRWLTDNSKDFVMVCHFAGMDPDYVRRRAKRALLAPVLWRAEPGKGRRYLERRAYRQKHKKQETQESETPGMKSCVIKGPW